MLSMLWKDKARLFTDSVDNPFNPIPTTEPKISPFQGYPIYEERVAMLHCWIKLIAKISKRRKGTYSGLKVIDFLGQLLLGKIPLIFLKVKEKERFD